MRYRDAGFYEQNGCRVLYGKSAVRLDAAAKTVELDDGTILPYDSICVAAGSSPFLPPLEGLETVEKAFTFMTLDDALALGGGGEGRFPRADCGRGADRSQMRRGAL